MHEILACAKHVVFLTPSYKQKFLSDLPPALSKVIDAKSVVISNGISPSWLNTVSPRLSEITVKKPSIQALYVGDFSPNKNLVRLIRAIQLLRSSSFPISLTIVGEGAKRKIC